MYGDFAVSDVIAINCLDPQRKTHKSDTLACTAYLAITKMNLMNYVDNNVYHRH